MNSDILRSPKQIGNAIRRRRRSLDMNQTELGQKTHLRQASISGLEAGNAGTSLRTLFDALTALDLELVVRERTKASSSSIEELF